MNKRKIAVLAALAALMGASAFTTLSPRGNRVLAKAFPSKLLASPESCTTPAWPAEARRYEVEGITVIHFRIGEDGAVVNAEVAASSGWALLDQAALQSLVKCKFKPGLAEAAERMTFPIQFVWTLSGPPAVRPQLVPGSCAASRRFGGFEEFNRKATAADGVLVRFLVDPQGVPYGIKAARGDDPDTAEAAAKFLATCKFAVDLSIPGEKTDTAFGRVLARPK